MDLHPLWEPHPEFQSRLKEVGAYLEKILEETPVLLRKDLDIVLNPGKMLRPAFLLMASTAGDDPSPHLSRVAAALELMHTATLIHDDVIDQSASRRNRPALHVKSGFKRAVLSGDYLFARSLELASAAHNDQLVNVMNRAVFTICMGEIEQDGAAGDYLIDRETYFNRIRGKTAELFAVSCRVGALLGGADEEISERFYQAGLNFGFAFQIMDDVLDYRGSLSKMGKPPGNDLKDGVPTLPLILALESGDGTLIRLCRSKFKYNLRHLIRRRVLSGGWDKAAAVKGADYMNKSMAILEKIDFKDRDLFISVIGKLINTGS